jgi:argininosuccinate lyase
MGNADQFPAPEYASTVLAPAFSHGQEYYFAHLMRLHRAHGIMLAEQGLLSEAEISTILKALDDVENHIDARSEPEPYTGEFEDMFFFVERMLADRIDPDIAGRLHTGRSRNDIDHTIFKLVLRGRLDDLIGRLLDVVATLVKRSQEESATIVLAYTHGQPAQPSTYGHYLSALTETLLRDVTRLFQARDVVDRCTMGAAAITTTGFPLNRARVAELLGFRDFLLNSYGCIASSDYTAGVYSALKIMALNLGRFAQDLSYWTAFEVGQLRFSDGYVQISSIMPQKRNPVPVEHLRLMASLCAGKCDAVLTALHNTPFTDMNDNEHETHVQGYEAIDIVERALVLLGGVLSSAMIDERRARANIETSYATITELADSIVRQEKLPFSIAHHVAAHLARHMQRSGETLTTVSYETFAEIFTDQADRAPTMTEELFRHVVTPEHFIAVRKLPGGPAPEPMRESLDLYAAQELEARRLLEQGRARNENAVALMAAAIAHMVPLAKEEA